MKRRININPVTAAIGLLIAFVVIIVIIVVVLQIFRKNPYGDEIKIANYSEYFRDAPEDNRDYAFAELYRTVKMNYNGEVIPDGEGIIRDGSVSVVDNGGGNMLGTFIVDLPFVSESYYGTINWIKGGNDGINGYLATITCLDKTELIYGDFDCVDNFTRKTSVMPLCDELPKFYSDYDVSSRMAYSYSLSCYIDNNGSNVVIIDDYSGGNYDNALNKIRELGFNPADYEIKYDNHGGDFGN